jgi:plastocyanin
MHVLGLGRPLIGLLAAASLAGCGGQVGTSSLPASSSHSRTTSLVQRSPATEITPDTAVVGVRLNGETPTMTVHYGKVLGYFKGLTSTKSQVVVVFTNQPIVFTSVDKSSPHTVSFLGNATRTQAPWPAHFNGGTNASPAGTVIGTTNFSTGTLQPGKSSLVYNTGAPGFYMIGCAFHYDFSGMRTVVVVK